MFFFKFYFAINCLQLVMSHNSSNNDVFLTIDEANNNIQCITDTNDALVWINDEDVHTSSVFVHTEKAIKFNCNIEKGLKCLKYWRKGPWKLMNSIDENLGEIIVDRRWEYFTEIRTENGLRNFVREKINENFEIPLSIRTNEEAHVYFLNSTGTKYYDLQLQFNYYNYSSKIQKCIINKQSKKHYCDTVVNNNYHYNLFVSNKWNHFKVKKNSNVFFFESYNNIFPIMNFTDFGDVMKIREINFESKNKAKGFWKWHNYDYLYSDKKMKNFQIGPKIEYFNITGCLSMFVRMCTPCSITLTLKDNYNNFTLFQQTFNSTNDNTYTSKWREIRLIADNIYDNTVYLFITTESALEKGSFWAIDDVKLCHKSGYRSIRTNKKKQCQLVSKEYTLPLSDKYDRTSIKYSTCSTSEISTKCAACDLFYQSCNNIQVYENQASYSCSPGFFNEKCVEDCPSNSYGHNCQNQAVKQCYKSNKVTGNCFICQNDDLLPRTNCLFNSSDVVLIELVSSTETSCNFKISNNKFLSNLQYKLIETNSEWKTFKIITTAIENVEMNKLTAGSRYRVRFMTPSLTILSDEYDCQTKCKDVSKVVAKNTSAVIYTNCAFYYFEVLYDNTYVICNVTEHARLCSYLNPSTKYSVNIANSKEQLFVFVTKEGVPSVVRNLTVEENSPTSVTVFWEKPLFMHGTMKGYGVTLHLKKFKSCTNNISVLIKDTTTDRSFIKLSTIAYAEYLVTVSAYNYNYNGEKISFKFSTGETDLNAQEVPTLKIEPNIIKTKISLIQPNCTFIKHKKLSYTVFVTCKKSWCKKNNESVVILNNEINLELSKFINYDFKLTTCYNKCINSTPISFTTPPTEPNRVENITVYSKGEDYVLVKWLIPYPPTGTLKNYSININSAKCSIGTLKCQIWSNWHCAKCESLKLNRDYTINIAAQNKDVDTFGEINAFSFNFINFSESQPPSNLNYFWDEKNNLNLSWNHPFITNGELTHFNINITNEVTKTYVFDISNKEYNQTYYYNINNADFKFSTNYTISIAGFNCMEGTPLIKDIQSPPKAPQILFHTFMTTDNLIISENLLENYQLNEIVSSYIFVKNLPKIETFDELDKMLNFENYGIFLACRNIKKGLFNVTINKNDSLTTIGNSCEIYNKNLFFAKSKHDYRFVTESQLNSVRRFSLYDKIHQIEANEANTIQHHNNIIYGLCGGLFFVVIILIIILFLMRKKIQIKLNRKPSANNTYETFENNVEMVPTSSKKMVTIFSKKVKVVYYEKYVQAAIETNELAKQHSLIQRQEPKPMTIGLLPENRAKHRYKNLLAFDHTRVVLKSIEEGNSSDYINANYVNGYKVDKAYIATQGPIPSTLNDFWQMIWQENVHFIVILANCYENGKISVEQYWPNLNQKLKFNAIEIEAKSIIPHINYEERHFILTNQRTNRKLTQLHFNTWPDNGHPMYPTDLVPLLQHLQTLKPTEKSPILVHCSAGVGRTGVLLLCDIALRMAGAEHALDLLKIVSLLRQQRLNLVDNVEQYKLAHLTVLEYLHGRSTLTACRRLQSSVRDILTSDRINREMNYLDANAWQDQVMQLNIHKAETFHRTFGKNRFETILPEAHAHIVLKPFPVYDQSSRYINAIKVDGFRTRNQFIVTQQPLFGTISDFWRLVDEKNVQVVLSLNAIDETRSESYMFYPTENEPIITLLDYLTIEWVKSECFDTFDEVHVNLTTKNSETNKKIVLLANRSWQIGVEVPDSSLFLYWKHFNALPNKHAPVLVTCFDGVTASGLYLTMDLVIERFKFDQNFDLWMTIRTIRRNRKEFMRSLNQVLFIYKIALEFIQQLN